MNVSRRSFLKTAVAAAASGAGVAGPSALATTLETPGNPSFEELASFAEYPGKIVVIEPHLDDKEIFLSPVLFAPDLYLFYGVIPQTPAAVLASLDSLRPGGPFRPVGFSPIVQMPLQTAFNAEGTSFAGPVFDQDWFSRNVIPLRIEDPEERLAALGKRDAIYADPMVLREKLRPTMYALAASGATKFVTLNPAGTYGHPHHMALSEAVADIAVEIYDRLNIRAEVWNDATLRRDPGTADPTGQTLYRQARDIPGVRYAGPFKSSVEVVRAAMDSYRTRFIDPEKGVDCDTWHEEGDDFVQELYLWRRVGFNPETGRVEDVLKTNADTRAFWDDIKKNEIPPTYVVPVEAKEAKVEVRRALRDKKAHENFFGILAPVL